MLKMVSEINIEFDIKIPIMSWAFMDYRELEEMYEQLKAKGAR